MGFVSGFIFVFEAELSVFLSGLLCFCAAAGRALALDVFIIDSER